MSLENCEEERSLRIHGEWIICENTVEEGMGRYRGGKYIPNERWGCVDSAFR